MEVIYKSRLTNNKFSSPNLLENRYNRSNNYNLRYYNNQRDMTYSPVPMTQFSTGLQAPTIIGRNPMTLYSTIPYQTINPYGSLKNNKSENIFKMNILNNRINQLEEENKVDKLRLQKLIEDNVFYPDKYNNYNRVVFNSNRNYINNINSLDQAMDNLEK